MQRERDVYVRFCICNTINANPHPVREIQTVSRCVFGEIRERKMVNQPKVRDDHPSDCVDVNKPLDCDLTTFLIILPELIESAQHPWYPS